MAASGANVPPPIRISKIAGRFLVFDSDALAHLRRHENINGTLVGTAPQQPTQNIFLNLPAELRPEEASALVAKKAAYVVDDVAAHQAVLKGTDHPEARKAYIESLRRRKADAQKAVAERQAQKAAESASRRKLGAKQKLATRSESAGDHGGDDADDALFSSSSRKTAEVPAAPPQASMPSFDSIAVTPTSSGSLIPIEVDAAHEVSDVPIGPLCQHLQRVGYYMTPGLRFGAQYSVYPGDPLRFHAHFMANEYGWEEEIPILEIVEGGRLATAVKKAFLVGGQPRSLPPQQDSSSSAGAVRTFSIEWAGM